MPINGVAKAPITTSFLTTILSILKKFFGKLLRIKSEVSYISQAAAG